jgi:hypothetical protein
MQLVYGTADQSDLSEVATIVPGGFARPTGDRDFSEVTRAFFTTVKGIGNAIKER